MPRWNGGVIGAANNPTSSSAKGIWSLSEATKAIRAGLWPPSNAGADPYFENVTLLLPGDGTNGAQNNTFLDSSTNNFTITRNGNTTQGTFSPFSKADGRWGAYFDGTGDYLSVANNAALDLGTGDFTIEGWWYFNDTSNQALVSKYSVNNGYVVQYQSGNLRLVLGKGASDDVNSFSWTPTANTWYHIAITRSGTSGRAFVNGIQIGTTLTFTTSNTAASTTLQIGSTHTVSELTRGYVSNFRLVKGTAVYTAAFTTPTAPLTAITNTSLLTCQSNRFIDNSTNAFAITPNGDVSVQTFSPFPSLTAYAAGTNGGSGYFDGSGDHLITPSNAALGLGTGDFTVECWYYHLSRASTDGLFAPGTSNLNIYINTSGTLGYFNGTSGQNSSQTVPLNTWGHIALVRVSGTIKMYYNGVEVLSQSNTTNFSTTNWYIGTNSALDNDPAHGYMTDARIVKGTAVYTSAFTPPTTPLTAISGTSLLLNFTNGGIIDTSMSNDLETVGNAQISTTQSKFGGASMYFDGTGDYLKGNALTAGLTGSGDFTIEGWVYISSLPGAEVSFCSTCESGGTGIIFGLGGGGNVNKLQLAIGNLSVGNPTVVDSVNFTTGAWVHFAAVRYNGTIYLYKNGTSVGTPTSASGTLDRQTVTIGAFPSGASTLTGYIDDLRISKGLARYTANFTAPTAPFNGFGD